MPSCSCRFLNLKFSELKKWNKKYEKTIPGIDYTPNLTEMHIADKKGSKNITFPIK